MTSSLLRPAPGGVAAAVLDAVAPTWQAAVDHRFVRELFAGTIADAVLATYLVQDHRFFDGFLRLVGQLLAATDRLDARLTLGRQLGMLAADESTYFTDCFAALDADTRAPTAPVTQAFGDLMDETVATRDPARLLPLLVVMEGVYLDWGSRTDLGEPTRPEHRGWIELHRGPAFAAWSQWLVDELDRLASRPGSRRDDLIALAAHATDLEVAFFDAAYAPTPAPSRTWAR